MNTILEFITTGMGTVLSVGLLTIIFIAFYWWNDRKNTKHWEMSKGDICQICKRSNKTSKRDYFLPGVHSFFLQGEPFICDQCFYEKLTGTKFEWNKHIKKILD